MFHWAGFLRLKPKNGAVDSRVENSAIRLLVVTDDDRFYSGLVDIATRSRWEIRRAGSISEALDTIRILHLPLVILDWHESANDWRHGLDRICAAHTHPCVLLASRVMDDNLRQEVLRHRGYDVLPRAADHDQLVRAIEFAWFWTTRSRSFNDAAAHQGARS